MPNWCQNYFSIKCKNPELAQKIKESIEEESLCRTFCPVPKELEDLPSPAPQEIAQKNIEKYGYPSWYEFCHSNWGTKWDICEPDILFSDNLLVEAVFDTAWKPPIKLLEKLFREHEKDIIYIYLQYNEPDMGLNGVWKKGGK